MRVDRCGLLVHRAPGYTASWVGLALLVQVREGQGPLRLLPMTRQESFALNRAASDLDVAADLEDLLGWQLEEPAGAVGATDEQHEEVFEQWVHAFGVALDG